MWQRKTFGRVAAYTRFEIDVIVPKSVSKSNLAIYVYGVLAERIHYL